MTSLNMNLVKRVERLPKPTRTSEAMQPLFEAVSNSIHSTQQKYGNNVAKKGQIEINVISKKKGTPLQIIVEDNGMGLDEKHFDAFMTTDTDNKISIGGKGVGRLLWLDCFEKISIASNYLNKSKQLRHRSFNFQLSQNDQIQNLKDKAAVAPLSTNVLIKFEGLRDNGYLAKFPTRATYIFQHFTSHFLPSFIGKKSPKIIIHCGDETRTFPEAIDSIIYRRKDIPTIATEAFGNLTLTLMECDKVASADLVGSHFIHFIAHDRTVHSQKIDGKLGLKYFGENEDRVFHACLFGDFLNKSVNQERTRFTFEDAVIEHIVNEVCIPNVEKFLAEPLAALKGQQSKIVAEIIDNYPSVAFGEIDELQEYIPTGELSDDAIYGHLSRQRFRRDQKQTEKIKDVLKRLKDGQIDESSFSNALKEASVAIGEAEQKSLAEYIVRRKVVLDFLEILIQKVRVDVKDSSYQREEILHTFLCPMRVKTVGKDKEVTPAASHDLWVIDERLTFARYFSSDVPFTELADALPDEDRADLLIFDKVHSLRQDEDTSKVLLVEFKRPGRTTYAENENPQHQIERYIKKLLAGGQVDVKGRPIKFNKNTIFYCFIVADCLGRIDEWTYSWKRTADGRGRIYQPGDGFAGSIELIGWDALIEDARHRNRAFFDHAGIPKDNLFTKS